MNHTDTQNKELLLLQKLTTCKLHLFENDKSLQKNKKTLAQEDFFVLPPLNFSKYQKYLLANFPIFSNSALLDVPT